MKTLLLLRHAKSSWDQPEMKDHDRPLNKRGKKEAPKVGKYLKDNNLVPDLILSSTARRAHDTAQAVAEESGFDKPIELNQDLYMSDPACYLDILQQPTGKRQPGVGCGPQPRPGRITDHADRCDRTHDHCRPGADRPAHLQLAGAERGYRWQTAKPLGTARKISRQLIAAALDHSPHHHQDHPTCRHYHNSNDQDVPQPVCSRRWGVFLHRVSSQGCSCCDHRR